MQKPGKVKKSLKIEKMEPLFIRVSEEGSSGARVVFSEIAKIDSLEWFKIIFPDKGSIRFFSFSRVIKPGLIFWGRLEGFAFNTMLNLLN